MNTIQVYDPPLCCPTGVCGTQVDPALARFAALLQGLAGKGVHVQRHNLGQQPLAFVQNEVVKALLEKEGLECLPLIFLNGEIHFQGRYPKEEEGRDFLLAALGKNDNPPP